MTFEGNRAVGESSRSSEDRNGNHVVESTPRVSQSDSDHHTLTDSPVQDNSSIARSSLPRRPPPIRTKRDGRKPMNSTDSWGSAQLSSSGTLLGPQMIGLETSIMMLQTDSPKEGMFTDAPLALETLVAEPGHFTRPPVKEFQCTFPTLRDRYDRKIIVEKNKKEWIFQPLETFTVHDVYLDPRWMPFTQPEGQLYFYSPNREGRFRYLTEEHLYEQKKVDEIELFIEHFEMKAEQSGLNLPDDAEVYLAIDEYEVEGWYYYCVDQQRRCLFWLDEVDLTWMSLKVDSVPSKHHLKYALDYEYWIHMEHFPFHQKLPPSLIDDLMGVVLHASIDCRTSLDSNVPYSAEEILEIVGLVKHLHTLQKTGEANGYLVASAARLMSIFVNERYYHFAGQHGARLTRDRSIRSNGEKRRTWLIYIMSPVLFYAPETHLKALDGLYIDETIKANLWKGFITKLEEDWVQYVLYATVLLTADVSFLAIPNVQPNPSPGQPASSNSTPPAVVTTQLSLIASIGSIILGLLLIREHRKKASDSAVEAADFIWRRSHPNLGLESLAVLYSLPYALLMWGMASFLAALAIVCFTSAGLVPAILYGVVWLFIVMMLLATVITQWEARMGMNWREFWLFRHIRWRRKAEDDEEKGKDAETMSISTSNTTRKAKRRIVLDYLRRQRELSTGDEVTMV